jgi:hypothetical protein
MATAGGEEWGCKCLPEQTWQQELLITHVIHANVFKIKYEKENMSVVPRYRLIRSREGKQVANENGESCQQAATRTMSLEHLQSDADVYLLIN